MMNSSPRREAFFGFGWRFALTDSADLPSTADVHFRPVQLPHDWSIDYPYNPETASAGSGGYVRTGIGWYAKTFTLPQDGRRHSLLFEGVYMNCRVFLNGILVAANVYGYTPFEVSLADAVPGENTVLVCADNARQPNSRWYSGSGITRPVYLRSVMPFSVPRDGIFVTTPEITAEQARLCIQTALCGTGENAAVEYSVRAPDGNELPPQRMPLVSGTAQHQAEIPLPSPQLWDIEHPQLYRLTVRLFAGEVCSDETTLPFGVRDIRMDANEGFFLNRRRVKLHGVCLHHDGGAVGAAVPPEVWNRRLKLLREMGCNAIRTAHNPPDSALLDLCDQMGFLVMDEAFDEWEYTKEKSRGANTHESRGYSEWFAEHHEADFTAMLRRDRNHPCIFIWSIGNEVPEQHLAGGAKIARRLAEICRREDPSRLLTQGNDCIRAEPYGARDEFLQELDVIGLNYVNRWRNRTETFYDEERHDFPQRIYIGTEHGAVDGVRGDYRQEVGSESWHNRPYFSRMLQAEKLLRYNESRGFVLGDFMWTGIDHLGESFWPLRSATTGVMDLCAFPKDGYYFYQSQWTKTPMLHLFPHWNLAVPEGSIVPVVVYTNCARAELFVNGKSYGKKAYEFPAQGMTQRYNHFERPIAPVTTNDLHLTWDVPYVPGKIEAVGYDENGNVLLRKAMHSAGAPTQIRLECDSAALPADGQSVCHITATLRDAAGHLVPHRDMTLRFAVQGAGEFLCADSGDPASHRLFADPECPTLAGKALCIVRAGQTAGAICVTVSAEGLPDARISLQTEA